jgi:hypothetical protein
LNDKKHGKHEFTLILIYRPLAAMLEVFFAFLKKIFAFLKNRDLKTASKSPYGEQEITRLA